MDEFNEAANSPSSPQAARESMRVNLRPGELLARSDGYRRLLLGRSRRSDRPAGGPVQADSRRSKDWADLAQSTPVPPAERAAGRPERGQPDVHMGDD